MASEAAPLTVAVEGIGKRFAGTRALTGVSLTFRSGEVHAVLGHNGAGKTTLIGILGGALAPDEGRLYVNGSARAALGVTEAAGVGIAVVHQELSLFPYLSVAENLFLGLPQFYAAGFYSAARARREAQAIFRRLTGAAFPVERRIAELSVAQRQLVEIARALYRRAKLIILDEPTASLTQPEIERLFIQIEEMKRRGIGFILVTHKLDEAMRMADCITVLRDGRVVAGGLPRADWSTERLIGAMIGSRVAPPTAEPDGAAATFAPPALEVRDLLMPHFPQPISLAVGAGEIVGLVGLMGSGRSMLCRAILGLGLTSAGQIRVAGRPIRRNSYAAAIGAGVGFVPEDRKTEGLILPFSVAANIALPRSTLASAAGLISARRESVLAARMMATVAARPAEPQQAVGDLSGGNQQKIALARWLALDGLKVLLLDEPTKGVDVGAKAQIHAVIRALAARGLGILFVSSEFDEALALAGRIIVLRRHRLAGEAASADLSKEALFRWTSAA